MSSLRLSKGRQGDSGWRTMVHCAGVSAVGLMAMLLAACGSGNPDANVAQNIINQFYQARIQKNEVKAAEFYSSKHLPEERKAYLEQLKKELGQVKSYHIKREEVNTVLRGRFYIYDVQVEYDLAGAVTETLTVFNEVGSNETLIVAQSVSYKNRNFSF